MPVRHPQDGVLVCPYRRTGMWCRPRPGQLAILGLRRLLPTDGLWCDFRYCRPHQECRSRALLSRKARSRSVHPTATGTRARKSCFPQERAPTRRSPAAPPPPPPPHPSGPRSPCGQQPPAAPPGPLPAATAPRRTCTSPGK